MWVWVDRIGEIVLDASLSATALLCLVALAMLGCRQPARRIRLARVGIVCSIVLIPLRGLAPLPRLDLIQVVRNSELRTHPLWRPATPIRRNDARFSPADRFPIPFAPIRLLTVVYLGGIGIGLAWFFLGYGGLGWLIRRSTEPSDDALALYRSIPYPDRLARPRLRISARVRRPVLVGLIRQTILIPPDLGRAEAAVPLRLSLLHEVAHAERADPWVNLAANLAQALWFFLPPLWWIRTQLRLDQEFMADRRAAAEFDGLASYASSLLTLASPHAGLAAETGTTGSVTGIPGTALTQRVLMLLHCPFPVETRPPAWWRWSLSSFVFMTMLAVSTLGVRVSGVESQPTSFDQETHAELFRMKSLAVPERSANARGRSPLVELPIRLPVRFDLTLEVWGDPSTLPRTRVAGHRLGSEDVPTLGSEALARWHQVHLLRDREGVSLTLDERPVPVARGREVTTTWLSVEPAPREPGRFRGLALRW